MSQQFWDVSKGCTCLNIFWSPPPRIWTFIVQLHALKSSSQTRFSPFYNHASRQLPAYHRPCQPTHYIYERRSFCSNIEKSGHASPLSPSPPVSPSLSPNLIKQNNEQWRLLLSKSYWTIFHLSCPGVCKNLTKPCVHCFADPSPSHSSLIRQGSEKVILLSFCSYLISMYVYSTYFLLYYYRT